MADPPLPDLSTRLALRQEEAALALGVSVRTLRSMLPKLPVVRCGTIPLFPVEALRDWLKQEARVEGDEGKRIADQIVRDLTPRMRGFRS